MLAEGNSVILIKDLKVKGSSLRRGTLVKNIRLTNSAGEIEGRAGDGTMVLKTEFLKKAQPLTLTVQGADEQAYQRVGASKSALRMGQNALHKGQNVLRMGQNALRTL